MRDFHSIQLDDEDSSKYFINYMNDVSNDLGDAAHYSDNEHIPSPDNTIDIDVSSLPNSVIITPVPKELFIDQQIKVKFAFTYFSIN